MLQHSYGITLRRNAGVGKPSGALIQNLADRILQAVSAVCDVNDR
jgi:hypothetical protein